MHITDAAQILLKSTNNTSYMEVFQDICILYETSYSRNAAFWLWFSICSLVLRCLGIPTRTITNFSSAHDADRNLRVDEFYDASGNHLDRAADSIW